MDYKKLLQKYMAYVLDTEGTDYVGVDGDDLEHYVDDDEFSDEEKAELVRMSRRNQQ